MDLPAEVPDCFHGIICAEHLQVPYAGLVDVQSEVRFLLFRSSIHRGHMAVLQGVSWSEISPNLCGCLRVFAD